MTEEFFKIWGIFKIPEIESVLQRASGIIKSNLTPSHMFVKLGNIKNKKKNFKSFQKGKKKNNTYLRGLTLDSKFPTSGSI